MSDNREERPWLRMIQQRQQRIEAIIDECKRKANEGRLTPGLKRELAVETEGLYRQLEKFAGESVLDGADLPDIEPIRERSGRQKSIVTTTNKIGGGLGTDNVPMIDELGLEYLLETANSVQDTAKRLGFWASVSASPSGGSKLPNPSKLSPDGPDAQLPGDEATAAAAQFEQSHFFRSLYKDVEGSRGGGAIVIVDAEDARTGVGKTGAACAMAEFVSWYFGYELREEDGVLSGQQYLKLFQEHPNEEQVSVCVWDEAVGAGSGDARRSMAQENVDLGRAWQIMRDRRVITFVTLPDWGDLDSRLQKLADYRVWCRRDIGSMQAYEIGTTFEGGDIRTRGLGPGDGAEPIAFPDVTEDSGLYQAIKEKKDAVQESDSLDAGELVDGDDSDDDDGTKSGPDLHAIADEVCENVDDYVSVHGGNGTRYVDTDLIELEHDLSIRKAEKVKKLVEKEGVEL